MQKAKKMSKQTLVIAVLAVLLVLSLALTVTGAWFTDTATDTNSTSVTFATVSVTATAGAKPTHNTTEVETVTNVLPGDTIGFSGKINNEGSTVDILVGVLFSDVKLVATIADGTKYDITANAGTPSGGVLTGATAVENVTFGTNDEGVIYLVEVGDDTVEYSYTGSFTFGGAELDNYAQGTKIEGDNTASTLNIVLNKGAYNLDELPEGYATATFELSMSVQVFAIQYDNLTGDDLAGKAGTAADIFDDMIAEANEEAGE